MRTESTRWRRLAAVAVTAAGLGVTVDQVVSQQPVAPTTPAPEPTLIDPKAADYGSRPVALIYGTVPVTRADLAEFLIARGGYEKVELLVNKKIIETEAARRNLTVTTQEMEAALEQDLKITSPPISKKDFVNVVLPRYGKTLYEWMEDVVRPRLLLTKMCKDKVEVTEKDLQIAYEREYGEKRDVRLIIWPKGDDPKALFRIWDQIRKSDEEFDRVARQQANPSLAATAGKVKPMGRHTTGDDKKVEEKAFALKEGEVSELFETAQGYMVIKLVKIIPANAAAQPDPVTKKRLHDDMFEEKLSQEIPKQFAALSKAAAPALLLNGPPSQWKFEQTNKQMAEDVLRQQGGGK